MKTLGQFLILEVKWEAFKDYLTDNDLQYRFEETDHEYTVVAVECYYLYQCLIYKDGVPPGAVMSEEENTAALAEFEASYKSSGMNPVKPPVRVANTVPITGKVEQTPLEGRRYEHYTSDFCKKETWWQDSARVTNETYTDSGNHQLYLPATERYCVDVTHGKIFREWELQEDYAPVVKVDNVTKTENPAGKTTGDYSFNYVNGRVTFNSALTGSEVVTVSYSYVRTSLFRAYAPEGYKWTSNIIKVMYSKDLGMTDTIYFQLWGNIGAGMQPLSSPEIYKTLDDMKKDASRIEWEDAIESGDPGAENAWRMPTKRRVFLYYDYAGRAATSLEGAYAMEIRCWLETDTPFVGEMGCATFFGRKDAYE